MHPARSLTGFFAVGPLRLASPPTRYGTTTTSRTSPAAAVTVPSTSGNKVTTAGGGSPSAVTVEVRSSREAALGLPVPDPEARCGFSVKWFEEGNASLFDKVKSCY